MKSEIDKSLNTLKAIMDVELEEMQCKDVLQKIVVMHPEINGIKEEQEKIK